MLKNNNFKFELNRNDRYRYKIRNITIDTCKLQ